MGNMAIFFMFGKYSHASISNISAKRTADTIAIINANGGSLKDGYVLLGEPDLVMLVEFPGPANAMKTSVELSQLFGIAFTTAPAMSFEDFDRLVSK
jgi:uncharacterized protein with GYD domain